MTTNTETLDSDYHNVCFKELIIGRTSTLGFVPMRLMNTGLKDNSVVPKELRNARYDALNVFKRFVVTALTEVGSRVEQQLGELRHLYENKENNSSDSPVNNDAGAKSVVKQGGESLQTTTSEMNSTLIDVLRLDGLSGVTFEGYCDAEKEVLRRGVGPENIDALLTMRKDATLPWMHKKEDKEDLAR